MTSDLINELKTAVFSKTEVLKQIYVKFGHLTLPEYVEEWKGLKNSVPKEVIAVIEECYAEIYGTDIAGQIIRQIQETFLVSTVDHHGILNHPFFLNANLVFGQRKNLKFLPVFSTNGISLNNSSWPGVLCVNNIERNILEKFSFFKDKVKTKTVFALENYKESDVVLLLRRINKSNFLTTRQRTQFQDLVTEIFQNSELLKQQNFSNQACVASMNLWHKIFPHAPMLVYLPLEELVNKILLKIIIPNTTHVLHKLFFQKEGLGLIEKYFFGLKGAFDTDKGSFLFWGVDSNGKRFAFKKANSILTSIDNTYSYELDPESIYEAITQKKLYPTSLVCFLVMLYYGLNCLGGFNQTSWLTAIKKKFISLLGEVGEKQQAEVVENVVTDNFSETPVLIVKKNGKFFQPALLDLYLNDISFEKCVAQAGKITLAQSIESELPAMYKIVVEDKKREQELKEITLSDIVEYNNMSILEL